MVNNTFQEYNLLYSVDYEKDEGMPIFPTAPLSGMYKSIGVLMSLSFAFLGPLGSYSQKCGYSEYWAQAYHL